MTFNLLFKSQRTIHGKVAWKSHARDERKANFTVQFFIIYTNILYTVIDQSPRTVSTQEISHSVVKNNIIVKHHLILMSLILFMCSFCHFRYHRIGLVVLFLHDLNDVFLEFSKLCVAFKTRNGKYCRTSDILSAVGFVSFVSSW